jgi:hypothetical protein
MGWTCNFDEETNTYRILVWSPCGKQPLEDEEGNGRIILG